MTAELREIGKKWLQPLGFRRDAACSHGVFQQSGLHLELSFDCDAIHNRAQDIGADGAILFFGGSTNLPRLLGGEVDE